MAVGDSAGLIGVYDTKDSSVIRQLYREFPPDVIMQCHDGDDGVEGKKMNRLTKVKIRCCNNQQSDNYDDRGDYDVEGHDDT